MKKKIIIISLIFLGLIILGFSVWFFFFNSSIIIKLNGKNIETIEVLKEYKEKGAKAYYKSGFKEKEIKNIKITNNVDISKLGEYKVNYKVKHKNKIKKITRIVKVVDKTSPSIEVEDNILVCPSVNIEEYNLNYKITDNIDTKFNINKTIKDNVISLEVEDLSHNKIKKDIKVEHKDIETPSISLIGDSEVGVLQGTSYIELGYSSYDNCDGNMTNKVVIQNNVNINVVGTYKVIYSVTDSSGNTSSVVRRVYVYRHNSVVIPNGKTVYLTFDDGPCAYTGELLDILNQYGVKATFFVTSQFGYDEYITRAYNEGHAIGLHSYTHNYSNIYSSENAYFDDLNRIRDKVYNLTGYNSNLVRFPGGSSNTVSRFNPGIITRIANKFNEIGYKYFDWNVASNDTGLYDSNVIADNIIRGISNNNYSIVLQHDFKLASVNAVRKVIEYGLSNGYNFMPLNESSPTAHHTIVN